MVFIPCLQAATSVRSKNAQETHQGVAIALRTAQLWSGGVIGPLEQEDQKRRDQARSSSH